MGGAGGAGAAVALSRLFDPDVALWAAAAAFTAAALTGVQLPSPASREPRRSRIHNYRASLSSRLVAAGVAMAVSRAAVGFLTFLLAFVLRAGGESGGPSPPWRPPEQPAGSPARSGCPQPADELGSCPFAARPGDFVAMDGFLQRELATRGPSCGSSSGRSGESSPC